MNPFRVSFDASETLTLEPSRDLEVFGERVVIRNGTELPRVCVLSGLQTDLKRESAEHFTLLGPAANLTSVGSVFFAALAIAWCIYFDAPRYFRMSSAVCFAVIGFTFLAGSCLVLRRLGTTIRLSWYVNAAVAERLRSERRARLFRRSIRWAACFGVLLVCCIVLQWSPSLRHTRLALVVRFALIAVGAGIALTLEPLRPVLRLVRWEGDCCEFIVNRTEKLCEEPGKLPPNLCALASASTNNDWIVSWGGGPALAANAGQRDCSSIGGSPQLVREYRLRWSCRVLIRGLVHGCEWTSPWYSGQKACPRFARAWHPCEGVAHVRGHGTRAPTNLGEVHIYPDVSCSGR